MAQAKDHRIYCVRCIHYHVTYDPYAPHGCKFFKMKSAQNPANLVKSTSGEECHAHSPRLKKPEKTNPYE